MYDSMLLIKIQPDYYCFFLFENFHFHFIFRSFISLFISHSIEFIWKALSYTENEHRNIGEERKRERASSYYDRLKMRKLNNLYSAPRVRFSIANENKAKM